MKKSIMSLLLAISVSFSVQAAEMNNDMMDHSKMDHQSMGNKAPADNPDAAGLQSLPTMPASGKAREGGYDDRYVMESTDVANALPTRCAQASRGLVMMNNAEWSRCGGKPDGAAQASRSVVGKAKTRNEHAGHNM
jgi:hypothetical protein